MLLAELVYGLARASQPLAGDEVGPKAVGAALFGPYVLGVELASMLLLAALVGAYHLAARARDEAEEREAYEHGAGRRRAVPSEPGESPRRASLMAAVALEHGLVLAAVLFASAWSACSCAAT